MIDGFRIPIGDGITSVIDAVTGALGGLFDLIAMIFTACYDGVAWALTAPPFWIVILVIAAIAVLAKGWKLALGSVIGLILIVGVDQWDKAMQTLALTLVAAMIAIVIAIPVGIWAARVPVVSAVIRPVLDFLQTMPAFVYLIPAITVFSVGVVPGIVATVLFAVAPGVRLTELGIRGVDDEVVEAGQAFGATPGRILRQIQLPLAMPSIMAGVNQVIMLSLSMVVIASMVGGPGLGKDIIQALSRVDIGLGFEAGLSVVIIAMILDRVTSGFGRRERARRTVPASSTAEQAEPVAS
ncbi:ABC transporter permease [Microbacterium panaciterrae]|uniref:Proline/glycine betaine ABC transporter permease n=1 Tax=Microbacterium panaciterrae TaxID=985759 RepID=A0ABP8PP06_9MICO